MTDYEQVDAPAGAVEEALVPLTLYREARRRLLVNQPLRDHIGSGSTAAHDLSAGEAEALASVGLSTARVSVDDHDPLSRSIADYMALLSTSLTTNQAAKCLKVDSSRVRQRIRERSLFGIEYEREHRLPIFQFERGHVLPGLGEVLAALPATLHPLDVAEWFLAPHPDLEVDNEDESVSPREWLLQGRAVSDVVVLARGF